MVRLQGIRLHRAAAFASRWHQPSAAHESSAAGWAPL